MRRLVTDYLDGTRSQYPDKVAFVDQFREITFAKLYEEACHVACEIIRSGHFKRPVLIYMDKCVSMISSFIGTAYSGNTYTPVDINMPEERVRKITTVLCPAMVITDRTNFNHARILFDGIPIGIFEDIMRNEYDEELINQTVSRVIDTDTLYILFTSGSTGVPKGVMINHRAVIDFTDWISDCYGFDETTVFANQAQLFFDLSIQDVYAPLRNGSTTILIRNRLYSSPVRVWKTILNHNVNTLVWIPTMLTLFANLDVLANTEKAPLKTVLFCGEAMPVKQLNYWISNYPDTVFGNLYGPTECTEACTYYTIDRMFEDDDMLPIGRPCENSDAFILSENGELITSEGIVGELCVRGVCLRNGYYGEPELTKEVFVQNPFNQKYRDIVYKTGDLVFYNERGELVYVCRKDLQVKVHGYRVELGEIEQAASSVEGVEYCCCLFDNKNELLMLVYTGDADSNDLKSALSQRLQEYMLPAAYIKRNQMLFNVNGKINRKALVDEYIEK